MGLVILNLIGHEQEEMVNTPDTCSTVWGDGFRFAAAEEWDDGNPYDGDGCATNCLVEAEYVCSDHDSDTFTPDICIKKCGNGLRTVDENWDDGNSFDYDGCSSNCDIEQGYLWSGGSPTTIDEWIENTFMPLAALTITQQNNLILTFNDTLFIVDIDSNDLYIRIYGTLLEYEFTWDAAYIDDKTVGVTMTYKNSFVGGNTELIVVEFVDRNKFMSTNSFRGVNIETDLSGYLYAQSNQSNTGVLGQSAMYIFLASVLLALISSFGGNSPEMMWGLMNTLQILYFTSYVYVEFPKDLDAIFVFLGWANANNQYLSDITYLALSSDKFNQDIVNDKIGEKSFYLNSSDKFPVVVLTMCVFAFTFLFDKLKLSQSNKWTKLLYKVVEYFKYNFFIRFGLELFLELFLNSLVNIYFVS